MSILITDNRQQITRHKGFTLMEILIAASIFAGVMVMTTGVLGQSASFRGKIRAMRETSEESKRLADMITRDVRQASGYTGGNYFYQMGSPAVQYHFKSGLALLNYNSTTLTWSEKYRTDISPVSGYNGNALIIATKDSFIFYGANSNGVCRGIAPILSSQYNYDLVLTSVATCIDALYIIAGPTANKPEVTLTFGGYLPDDTSVNKQQPFVMFDIVSKTKGYGTLLPNSQAKMEIRSSVTARSFAN